MKADATKIEEFLSSPKTNFVIPVYQRNYDWTFVQCEQLFQDIFDIGNSKETDAHFIGSIVYVHEDVLIIKNIKELVIIDGQQRLTTITLIYLALFRLAKSLNKEVLSDEILETYLTNKFTTEQNKLKLQLTEINNKALQYLLRNDPDEEFNEFSRIVDNYKFFENRINEGNIDIILRGISKLMFVEISLERRKDNPQRIFESLNSTGLDLSQADLIRNYILMDLNPKEQEKIYKNYWEIIEGLARSEDSNCNRISDFIRDYLTVVNKKIPNKGKVYNEFKNKFSILNTQALEKDLIAIKNLAKYYNKLINPKNEKDGLIRKHIEYINRIGINVAFPFLMKVYEDFDKKCIAKDDFIEVLELIQSYTWRRFIVGLPTSSLNKIFMNLYEKINSNNYLFSIELALLQKSGSQRFPRNSEIREALRVKDVYNINTKNRLYLFERLENHKNNEPVLIDSRITIEHIFPQNPDIAWKKLLGDKEYNVIKENYLNTIGNLTLSGNNGKLGNKSFLDKRNLIDGGYNNSKLWLNQYLSKLEKWDIVEIEKRTEMIIDRFLEIWKFPQINVLNAANSEINIFDAESPKHKKLEYVIFLDQKIDISQVSQLYQFIMQKLFEESPERFFNSELYTKLKLTKQKESGSPRLAVRSV